LPTRQIKKHKNGKKSKKSGKNADNQGNGPYFKEENMTNSGKNGQIYVRQRFLHDVSRKN